MPFSTSRPSSAPSKDTDTSAGNASANKVVCDIISFTDMSDPITVDLVSQKGFTIKNNGNDVDAKAVLYRGGEEIDTGGTAYTYTWKLWNSAGTSVVKTYTENPSRSRKPM
ncbi:hypothetical protein NXW09_29500 [Bacteroides ovatus]|nr:hypothetical protein [Bacteroides ovatus]